MEFFDEYLPFIITYFVGAFAGFSGCYMHNRKKFLHHDEAPKVSTNECLKEPCPDCLGTGKDGCDRCDPPSWYECSTCDGLGKVVKHAPSKGH